MSCAILLASCFVFVHAFICDAEQLFYFCSVLCLTYSAADAGVDLEAAHLSGQSYQLSRAALATVALLDGLDADFIPGQSTSPTCNYWSYLPKVSTEVIDNSGNR